MRIGFDAKRYFHNKTGLGNYSRDLVRMVANRFPTDEYWLYNLKPTSKVIPLPTSAKERRPDTWFFTRFYALWRFWYLSRLVIKDRIDIYHGLSGEIPMGMTKSTKIVVTIHDLIFKRYPHYYTVFDRYMHAFKFWYAVRKADVVVTISEQTKADLLQFIPIKPKRVEVVYQGCSAVFKHHQTQNEKEAVRQKFNLPDTFLLNVGTIETRKNILTVIKSLEQLPYHLVVVGKKTPYFTNEIAPYLAERPELSARIHFLKNVQMSELAALYQQAALFVYPSVFEGFGIPIIEALFSGTPVITNREGCFPEAAGPHSVLVNVHSVTEMAQHIDQLMQQPEQRAQMSQHGLIYAQRFTDELLAQQWHDLYSSL
ncbi:MAG: glycosyl transferase family 1 [Flavobacterium sp. BFFFF2]|nr:MAG: glycosyl transferase family 1 [Flavobacterium sp. BFFFF2]